MLLSADASVRWYIIILILIAGAVGVVFCLLLGPSVLFMRSFHLLCQCSLSINAPFYQCLLPLIYLYIDRWVCWYWVLSVIATVHNYTPPPHVDAYLTPARPSYQCVHTVSCLYASLSVNDPLCQCFCLLTEININSCDRWDCDS